MGLIIKENATQTKWPSGIIPYEFDTAWNDDHLRIVKLAMAEWMSTTNNAILFDMHHDHPHRIRFTCPSHSRCAKGLDSNHSINECQINVTDQSDQQIMVTALHELGHCIGLGHEQLRSDTPESVKLDIATAMCKGRPGAKPDFQMDLINAQIRSKQDSYIPVGAFDLKSIMLYSSGNSEISDGDVAAVNKLYRGK